MGETNNHKMDDDPYPDLEGRLSSEPKGKWHIGDKIGNLGGKLNQLTQLYGEGSAAIGEGLDALKERHPKTYKAVAYVGTDALKSAGIFLVASLASYLTNQVIGSLPAGEYITKITSPVVSGAVHWTLSGKVFGSNDHTTADFLNKWYAASHIIGGAVSGALNIAGYGVDSLVINNLNPTAAKGYMADIGSKVVSYSWIPSGLIAGACALGWKVLDKISGTGKFVGRHKKEFVVGVVPLAVYALIDYGSQYMGADPNTSSMVGKGAAATSLYIAANYLGGAKKWITKGVAAAYGGVLLNKTGLPHDAMDSITNDAGLKFFAVPMISYLTAPLLIESASLYFRRSGNKGKPASRHSA